MHPVKENGNGEALAALDAAMDPRVDDIRKQLLDRRASLLRAMTHVEDDLRWLDTNIEPEVVEEGQEASIARLLVRLDDRVKVEIEAIDAALARISTGDYGRCDACGQRIPAKRLAAMPMAVTCVDCATARERGPS